MLQLISGRLITPPHLQTKGKMNRKLKSTHLFSSENMRHLSFEVKRFFVVCFFFFLSFSQNIKDIELKFPDKFTGYLRLLKFWGIDFTVHTL